MIRDGLASRDVLAGDGDEPAVVGFVLRRACPEEEAFRVRKRLGVEGCFKRVDVVRGQQNGRAVEVGVGTTATLIEVLHPAVQVRVFAPVEDVRLQLSEREVCRGLARGWREGVGIHVEAHLKSPLFEAHGIARVVETWPPLPLGAINAPTRSRLQP